jgi:hypothetical protein
VAAAQQREVGGSLAAALSGMWRHVLTKDLFLYVENTP